jgi:hypothetical protein
VWETHSIDTVFSSILLILLKASLIRSKQPIEIGLSFGKDIQSLLNMPIAVAILSKGSLEKLHFCMETVMITDGFSSVC